MTNAESDRVRFSVYQGAQSDIAPRVTEVLGQKFLLLAAGLQAHQPRRAARIANVANKLLRCATSFRRWRCGHALCPRCSARKARRYRARLEEEIRSRPTGVFALVTGTVWCGFPREGLAALGRAFRLLVRRHVWRDAVAGGERHVEVKPARDAHGWNVHFHAFVELRPGRRLEQREVAPTWSELLTAVGLVGRFHVKPLPWLWAR